MGVRIKTFCGAFMLSATTFVSFAASAQEQAPVFRPRETVPEALNRAFYSNSGEFSDRKPFSTLELILGTPNFPENRISIETERIHRLYKDLLNQQVSSDPIIRTADLPNPYNTSVLTLPTANNRIAGSEFAIEQPLDSSPLQPENQPSQLPQRF